MTTEAATAQARPQSTARARAAALARGLAPRPRARPPAGFTRPAAPCALTRMPVRASAAGTAGSCPPSHAPLRASPLAPSCLPALPRMRPDSPPHLRPPLRFRIRPYQPADLDALILQPAQAHVQAQLSGRGYAQALARTEAYTVLLEGTQAGPGADAGAGTGTDAGTGTETDKAAGEGTGAAASEDAGEKPAAPARIIACLGVHAMHPGRALAWGLIARDCGPRLLALTRAVRRWLATCPYARVEAHAERGFDAGARWLRLLGFTCETPRGMRRYTPEGRDCDLYAWLREEPPREEPLRKTPPPETPPPETPLCKEQLREDPLREELLREDPPLDTPPLDTPRLKTPPPETRALS